MNDTKVVNHTREYCLYIPQLKGLILMDIAAFVGLVTNTIIFVALVRNQKLRKNAYIALVLLLSICDILLCLSALLITIHKIVNEKLPGSDHRVICTISVHFLFTGFVTSLGQTLLICINRVLAATGRTTMNKLLFHERKKYITCIAVFIFWHIYFLCIIPFQDNTQPVEICNVCRLYSGTRYWLVGTLTACAYSGNFLITVLLYIMLLFIIKRQNQKVIPGRVSIPLAWTAQSGHNGPIRRETLTIPNLSQNGYTGSQKSRIAALKTLTVLLIVFSILTLPILIASVIWIFNSISASAEVVGKMILLALLNTVTNPILYTWRFEELRKELKCMFKIK